MTLGIDTSHYGVGNLSPIPTEAAIDCAWSQGYKFWVVGLQRPDVYLPTIRMLIADGRFRIEAYTYLYQSLGPATQVRNAIDRLDEAGVLPQVKRLWLDYEHGAELPGDAEVQQIKSLVDFCERRGVDAGWYSGNWWTQSNISSAGMAELASIPYWIAYYVGGPNPIPGQPVHTKQWQGTTTVCGSLNVDLNWRPDAIWQAEQGDDDMATPEQLLEAARAMNRAQLGELNNILGEGKVSRVGYPDDPKLYATTKTQYHDVGDITPNLEAHWLKDQAEAGGEGAGGGDHTHPVTDHRHGGVEE